MLPIEGTMRQASLAQIFGVSRSSIDRALEKTIGNMLEVFRTLPEARVLWPGALEKRMLARLIEDREPMIKNAFGYVDGLNVAIRESSIVDSQNMALE